MRKNKEVVYLTRDNIVTLERYLDTFGEIVTNSLKITADKNKYNESLLFNSYQLDNDLSCVLLVNNNVYDVIVLANADEIHVDTFDEMFKNMQHFRSIDISEIHNHGNSMSDTFKGCINLVHAPIIPSGIISLGGTFEYCLNLEEAPIIPNGVRYMGGTFKFCKKLKKPPIIPDTVIHMWSTFSFCESLEEGPKLPNNITNIGYLYTNCKKLKKVPNLPIRAKNAEFIFYNCISLEEAPRLPSGVTNIAFAYEGCKLRGKK